MKIETIFSILFLACLITFTAGCSTASKNIFPSGGTIPEVAVETPHFDESDFRGLIANYYLDNGYRLEENQAGKLVLLSPPKTGILSNSYRMITFKLVSLRNQTRILAETSEIKVRSNGAVDPPVPLPAGHQLNTVTQNYLDELVRLVREE
ncbi:MAG: hypothetical protein ACLFN5_04455, partial [bacterium]